MNHQDRSWPDAKRKHYRQYLLLVLLSVQTVTYIDNRVLSLVLQDIKVDLSLSDTQLGFLTGIAFSMFYAVMGIPIAQWADRGNRVAIISITTALWSVATALCGTAGSFMQLLAIRVGVAVGEAGCIPPAQSLIADHFSRSERPRAVARYMLAAPLSLVLGYFLAGWLSSLYGWRLTFVILGLPGIVLSLLAWCTLREPRRVTRSHRSPLGTDECRRSQLPRPVTTSPAALITVLGTLWNSRTFRHLLIFYSIVSFFGYGISPWTPAFFARSHDLGTADLGIWLASVVGVSGLLGTFIGGEFVAKHCAQDERLQLRLIAIGYSSFGVVSACIYIAPNHYIAFAFMALAMFGGSAAIGPLFALIQTIVPAHMRAQAIALIYLFANLIGMGFGPLAVGLLSDGLRPHLGDESLRYSLLVLSSGYLWGGWHAWRAARTVLSDLAAAERETPAEPHAIGSPG